MLKSMLLLEVFDRDGNLIKRRISDNVYSIEDWLNANAFKWASVPVEVECDMYGDGTIHANGAIWYTFHTTSIGTV